MSALDWDDFEGSPMFSWERQRLREAAERGEDLRALVETMSRHIDVQDAILAQFRREEKERRK